MNRRKFLQVASVTTATLALNPAGKARAESALVDKSDILANPEAKGMLIDIPKCIGCGMCSVACQKQNELSATQNIELDDENWTALKIFEVEKDGKQQKRFVRDQCFHCLEPACVSACLVGAIKKTKAGPVLYDGSKCMGCRYCMIACPFNIPKYQWGELFPLIRKCVFCTEKLAVGEVPACVAACPTQATLFGTRNELVEEAMARIESSSGEYVPYIYGLKEVGGTSVLYISDVPFEDLGFSMDLGSRPLSDYTWMALSKVPAVALGGAVLLGATYQLNKDRGEEDEG